MFALLAIFLAINWELSSIILNKKYKQKKVYATRQPQDEKQFLFNYEIVRVFFGLPHSTHIFLIMTQPFERAQFYFSRTKLETRLHRWKHECELRKIYRGKLFNKWEEWKSFVAGSVECGNATVAQHWECFVLLKISILQ